MYLRERPRASPPVITDGSSDWLKCTYIVYITFNTPTEFSYHTNWLERGHNSVKVIQKNPFLVSHRKRPRGKRCKYGRKHCFNKPDWTRIFKLLSTKISWGLEFCWKVYLSPRQIELSTCTGSAHDSWGRYLTGLPGAPFYPLKQALFVDRPGLSGLSVV